MIKHCSPLTSSLWALLLLLQTYYALETVEFSTLFPSEQDRVMEYYSNPKGTRQTHENLSLLDEPCFYLQDSPELLVVVAELFSKDPEAQELEPKSQSIFEAITSKLEKATWASDLNPKPGKGVQLFPQIEYSRLILNVELDKENIDNKKKDFEQKVADIDQKINKRKEILFKTMDQCFSKLFTSEEPLESLSSEFSSDLDSFQRTDPEIASNLTGICQKFYDYLKKTSLGQDSGFESNQQQIKEFGEKIHILMSQHPPSFDENGNYRPEVFQLEELNGFDTKPIKSAIYSDLDTLEKEKQKMLSEQSDKDQGNLHAHLIFIEFQAFERLSDLKMEENENRLLSIYRFSNQLGLYTNLVSLWKALADKGFRQCELDFNSLGYTQANKDVSFIGDPRLDYIPFVINFNEIKPVNKACPFLEENSSFFSPDELFPSIEITNHQSERFSLYSLALMISSLEFQLLESKMGELSISEPDLAEDPIFQNLYSALNKPPFDSPNPPVKSFFDVLVSENQKFNNKIKKKIDEDLYDEFSVENRKRKMSYSGDLLFQKIKSIWRMALIQKGEAPEQVEKLIQPFDTLSTLVSGMINGEFGYGEAISQLQALTQSASEATLNLRDRELHQQPPRDRGTVIIRI